jgi:hypothetical protein
VRPIGSRDELSSGPELHRSNDRIQIDASVDNRKAIIATRNTGVPEGAKRREATGGSSLSLRLRLLDQQAKKPPVRACTRAIATGGNHRASDWPPNSFVECTLKRVSSNCPRVVVRESEMSTAKEN